VEVSDQIYASVALIQGKVPQSRSGRDGEKQKAAAGIRTPVIQPVV